MYLDTLLYLPSGPERERATMDLFTTIVLIAIAAGVLWVLWAAWLGRKLPIDEIIDKKRNEAWAAQLEIEEHEIPQMLGAANEYRRKRGLPQVTLQELQLQVNADLRHQIAEEAQKQQRAQQRHDKSARERRGF